MHLRAVGLVAAAVLTAGCDQFLTISRHTSESFSAASGDAALSAASTLLQQVSPGTTDVQCVVALNRSGSIGVFFDIPAPMNWVPVSERVPTDTNVIRTDKALGFVLGLPERVKVVHELTRCADTTSANFIGCAVRGSMVVEDVRDSESPSPSLVGPLWAHEFGHTQGLSHSTASRNVMRAGVAANNDVINQAQCNAFASPLTQAAGTSGGTAAAEVDLVDETMPIEEFIHVVPIDSMPVGQMLHYGPDGAAYLRGVLRDPSMRATWSMAASTLGMIGADEDSTALIELIERERSGRIGRSEYASIRSAIVALGYLVETTGSTRALDYLWAASDPGFWAGRTGMRWTSRIGATLDRRNAALSSYAVMGLGLSGSNVARDMLEVRARDWETGRLSSRGASQLGMAELIEQAMSDNERVAAMGLRGYYGE